MRVKVKTTDYTIFTGDVETLFEDPDHEDAQMIIQGFQNSRPEFVSLVNRRGSFSCGPVIAKDQWRYWAFDKQVGKYRQVTKEEYDALTN